MAGATNPNTNMFLNNRQVIKSLALNTAPSSTATWTPMCTMTEITLNTELEVQDFYVFCDAIKRKLVTGADLSIETTVKLDAQNVAIQKLLEKIHALLKDGDVAQFNNQIVQIELLSTVSNSALTYKKYDVPCSLIFNSLGGAAEDVSEFELEIAISGKAVESTVV